VRRIVSEPEGISALHSRQQAKIVFFNSDFLAARLILALAAVAVQDEIGRLRV
jgi:hypothetical protein